MLVLALALIVCVISGKWDPPLGLSFSIHTGWPA